MCLLYNLSLGKQLLALLSGKKKQFVTEKSNCIGLLLGRKKQFDSGLLSLNIGQ